MRNVERYQQLLEVGSPWTVSCVKLSVEAERVDVWVEHAAHERRLRAKVKRVPAHSGVDEKSMSYPSTDAGPRRGDVIQLSA